MPSFRLRETSIGGFAHDCAWPMPKLSLQWAGSIGNATIREKKLTHASRLRLRQKLAAGRVWLESSDIAPEIKQGITGNPIR